MPKEFIKDKFLTLRLPESVLAALRKQAAANDRTLCAEVLNLIKQHLGKVPSK